MELKKIVIENFKSIKEIELEVKKYGDSYTTMLLGINEAGKSNLLEAISYFKLPKGKYNYDDIANQKLSDKNEEINLFFYFAFENQQDLIKAIKEKMTGKKNLLNFEISIFCCTVSLKKGKKQFQGNTRYSIENLTPNLFFKEINGGEQKIYFEINDTNDQANSFKELTKKSLIELLGKLFKELLNKYFYDIVEKHTPKVTFWKAKDEYLINTQDLKVFKEDVESNLPLRNIFALAGYNTPEKIKSAIDNTITNSTKRMGLKRKLSKQTTNYIKDKWNHTVKFIIDIDQTSNLTVAICDEGESNEDNMFAMKQRSDGFKQFISLILSLSIERDKLEKHNRLILIDEAETHLHPSAIRDLRTELINLGENNYVFVSTHSPFLVDKEHKERNIILKKDEESFTTIKKIEKDEDLLDDEVLKEAFGIEVYKDLLHPHSILVEGKSDKMILQKALNIIAPKNFGITNGCGDNIVSLVSKLNSEEISVLVILDGDKKGRLNKEKIIEVGGIYTDKNVYTIRDIVGDITNNGTIEDTFDKNYITSLFKKIYNSQFEEKCPDFNLEDGKPYLDSMKKFLSQQKKNPDEILGEFKIQLSENFNPTETNLENQHTKLSKLCNKIIKILEKNENN